MRYHEETAKLNRTAIQVVGELFGLSLPERRLVVCPFPDHEDTAPSFQVRVPVIDGSATGAIVVEVL